MLSLCKENVSHTGSPCISKLDALLYIIAVNLIPPKIITARKLWCVLLDTGGKFITSLSYHLRNNIKGP